MVFYLVLTFSYDTFQDQKNLYFVMEYIPGGRLYNIVRYCLSIIHRKQLKSRTEAILFYAVEIAIALEYLHNKAIVHRDLKHDNILIDGKGHAKLLDLGLAKRLATNRTTTRCGTPGYMAPEQVAGKEYGKEVDLWAYGILLFELFAGYNPFEDKDNPQNSYSNLIKGNINWAPYMNEESKEFINKLLIIEPKTRLKISDFKYEPLFSVILYIIEM